MDAEKLLRMASRLNPYAATPVAYPEHRPLHDRYVVDPANQQPPQMSHRFAYLGRPFQEVHCILETSRNADKTLQPIHSRGILLISPQEHN